MSADEELREQLGWKYVQKEVKRKLREENREEPTSTYGMVQYRIKVCRNLLKTNKDKNNVITLGALNACMGYIDRWVPELKEAGLEVYE